MKKVLGLLIIVLFLMSCSDEPTKVTVRDDNQDKVAHLGPDPNLLGNTEIFFIPNNSGFSYLIINGPGAM